mgnify:FL=1
MMLTLTDDIVSLIDESINRGKYVSRSEIVRDALRKFFTGE